MESILSEAIMWRIYDAYLNSEGVCIDSRRVEPGMLFWALPGGRTHGDRFVADALDRGASFCVTSDPRWKGHPQCEVVEDPLAALQQLARHHRRRMNVPVVAVSGSNGKTTTKELAAAVLARRYRVLVSPGNYNNHIGLPLSLLQRRPLDPQLVIVELGVNHVGEMEQLLGIAEPTHGVLTNVGRDHMGEFGGLEGILQAYKPFVEYFRRHHLPLFWNADDELTGRLIGGDPLPDQKRISLLDAEADVVGRVLQEVPSLVVRFEKSLLPTAFTVRSPLFGRHHAYNIAMAVLLGQFFHVAVVDIQKAVEDTQPADNRGQILRTSRANTVILDAYNANPDSMRLTLDAFARWPRPRAVILADMEELGSFADAEHRRIVQQLRNGPWDRVFLVGPHFQAAASSESRFAVFPSTDELKEHLQRHPIEGMHVLLKGSRKHRLETLLDVL